MEQGRHEQVSEIFARARRLRDKERSDYLLQACADDATLRADVDSLLEHIDAEIDPLSDLARQELGKLAAESLDDEETRTQPGSVGPYRVIRVIGRGGMGIVYEAEQREPQRRVAVKVIRSGFFTEALLERFRHEVRILGRLTHPGIARIYEAGRDQSDDRVRPYLVMELIEGRPLLDYVGRENRDHSTGLKLLLLICDAIQHAHDRQVIHRDLKPGNILVTDGGQPKVLDFGVAGDAGSSAGFQPGAIVGTVPYMSPEQAAGESRLDGRSDVYSLGVILFEVLTGELPYPVQGLSLDESLTLIAERAATKLGTVDPSLRGDLEVIIEKSLSKNPDQRYPSARFLADDLRRYLRQEPISARRRSSLYATKKFLRRNWQLTTLSILILLLSWISFLFIRDQRQMATFWRDRAQRLEAATNQNPLGSTPSSTQSKPITRDRSAWDRALSSFDRRDHSRARHHFDLCYQVAIANGSVQTAQAALSWLALIALRQGDANETRRLLDRAQADDPTAISPPPTSWTLRLVAAIVRTDSDEESIHALNEIITDAKRTPILKPDDASRRDREVAYWLVRRGDPNRALGLMSPGSNRVASYSLAHLLDRIAWLEAHLEAGLPAEPSQELRSIAEAHGALSPLVREWAWRLPGLSQRVATSITSSICAMLPAPNLPLSELSESNEIAQGITALSLAAASSDLETECRRLLSALGTSYVLSSVNERFRWRIERARERQGEGSIKPIQWLLEDSLRDESRTWDDLIIRLRRGQKN